MTDAGLKNLPEIAFRCGFEKTPPRDDLCPVTPLKPDFVPSQIVDEARSGWFPKGVRACIGCELCSHEGASFASCADMLLVAAGPREGFFPRAFGGALDAVVTIQIQGKYRQNRLGWVTSELGISENAGSDGVGLFIGCAPYYDALLADIIGFNPTDEAHGAVALLNAVGCNPVVLKDEVCCGADRLHSGNIESFISLGIRNRDLFKERGVKTILTICNDCRFTLNQRYKDRIPEWDFNVMSVADYLHERISKLNFLTSTHKIVIQPSDRYSDPLNKGSVERLVSAIPQQTVLLMAAGHPSTFGSWNQFGAISKSMETGLLKAAESTGGNLFLMPSVRPLVRIHEGRRPGSWEETSIEVKGLYACLARHLAVAPEFGGA